MHAPENYNLSQVTAQSKSACVTQACHGRSTCQQLRVPTGQSPHLIDIGPLVDSQEPSNGVGVNGASRALGNTRRALARAPKKFCWLAIRLALTG